MTDVDFLDLVTRMRRAQSAYFGLRTPQNLERQVDRAIELAKDARTLLGFMSPSGREGR